MKKIIILSSLSLLLFGSCTKFNENNFPGYDEGKKPVEIKTGTLALVDADYEEMAKLLLAKKTKTDSTNAFFLRDNKCFRNDTIAKSTVPLLMKSSKFPFADPSSLLAVSLRLFSVSEGELPATKYTLVDDDYISMGTGSNMPGKYKDFSKSIDARHYLPIFLQKKYPYAAMNDEVALTYTYSFSSSSKESRNEIFLFNGSQWELKISSMNFGVDDDGKWGFVNTLVFTESFESSLGDFTNKSLVGNESWTWDTYKYAKATGYVNGANLEQDLWLISPVIDVSTRTKLSLNFMHVSRYSNDFAKDFTVWATNAPDNGVFNLNDWEQVNFPGAFGSDPGNWNLKPSGKLVLNNFAGNATFRFAFRYRSSAAKAGTWEVKDVILEEK